MKVTRQIKFWGASQSQHFGAEVDTGELGISVTPDNLPELVKILSRTLETALLAEVQRFSASLPPDSSDA